MAPERSRQIYQHIRSTSVDMWFTRDIARNPELTDTFAVFISDAWLACALYLRDWANKYYISTLGETEFDVNSLNKQLDLLREHERTSGQREELHEVQDRIRRTYLGLLGSRILSYSEDAATVLFETIHELTYPYPQAANMPNLVKTEEVMATAVYLHDIERQFPNQTLIKVEKQRLGLPQT